MSIEPRKEALPVPAQGTGPAPALHTGTGSPARAQSARPPGPPRRRLSPRTNWRRRLSPPVFDRGGWIRSCSAIWPDGVWRCCVAQEFPWGGLARGAVFREARAHPRSGVHPPGPDVAGRTAGLAQGRSRSPPDPPPDRPGEPSPHRRHRLPHIGGGPCRCHDVSLVAGKLGSSPLARNSTLTRSSSTNGPDRPRPPGWSIRRGGNIRPQPARRPDQESPSHRKPVVSQAPVRPPAPAGPRAGPLKSGTTSWNSADRNSPTTSP